MKVLALIPCFCFMLAGIRVSANVRQPLEKSNYVVIGAFSTPNHAIVFVESAKKNKFDAQFSINPARNLFYVYVLQTPDQKAAFEEAKKLRKETSYYDTWVFTGKLGDGNQTGNDLNPATEKGIERVEASDTKEIQVARENGSSITENKIKDEGIAPISPNTIEEMPEGGKQFFFKIFTSEKEMSGDVDIMDLDKTKPHKSASYRGNEVVTVKPINKSGNISLVCEVFGYRKIQLPVNFNNPQDAEGVSVEDNKVTVPFSLVRLKKGDIAIMYNVYFFRDAAIMRPESHYEVTSLLEMLKENPKYKIKLHGHANGNSSGKIISMNGPENFFNLKGAKEGYGSAKKLSEERARIIQNYLISQGINPERIQIKAWGGKHPIYKVDSQNAHANVRVEIEILED